MNNRKPSASATGRTRAPRISDVAELAAVSKMTVSRYVNKSGYVSEEAGKRIQKAINTLNYRPNQLARSLQTSASGNIAVILGNMASLASGEVIKGIETLLFEHKYNLLVGNTEFDPRREQVYIDMLLRKQIDGVLIAPSSGGEALRDFQERGTPMGFLFREIPFLNVDVVRFDMEHNMRTLVDHLLRLGHQRIALLCRDVDLLHGAPYRTGYVAALAAAGHSPAPELLAVSSALSLDESLAAIERLLALPQPPTAVCTTANIHTWSVLRHCERSGLRIPHDLMLASADTFGDLGAIIHPTITRTELPMQELGRCAAELLLGRIRGTETSPPRKVLMQGHFVQGESTRQGR